MAHWFIEIYHATYKCQFTLLDIIMDMNIPRSVKGELAHQESLIQDQTFMCWVYTKIYRKLMVGKVFYK